MPQSSRLGSLVQGEGHHVGTHTIGAHDNLISKRNFLGGTDPPSPPWPRHCLGCKSLGMRLRLTLSRLVRFVFFVSTQFLTYLHCLLCLFEIEIRLELLMDFF